VGDLRYAFDDRGASTLPLGTLVRVRHLVNNRKVDVRINDRGPFVRERERIIICRMQLPSSWGGGTRTARWRW